MFRLATGVFLLLAAVTVGCSDEAAMTGPPTVPVKLKLTLNGEPLPDSVNVRLLPEPPKEGITSIKGVRLSDGTYALETYEPGDGAPPGTYQIDFTPTDTTDVTSQVPQVKPATVIIPNEGGEVAVDLEGTGKMAPALLPPP
jgi:hypothetical protein